MKVREHTPTHAAFPVEGAFASPVASRQPLGARRASLVTLRSSLRKPADPLVLGLFRIAFGVVMALSALRFIVLDWGPALYVEPVTRFAYPGFGWVPRPSAAVLDAVLWTQVAAALGFAVGRGAKAWLLLFVASFTYVELLDATTYLNHYYFVSALGLLLLLLPMNAALVPGRPSWRVPAWTLGALRVHVGLVYFFAGVAKLHPDWLVDAQPLRIWLAARGGMPVIGPLLDLWWMPWAMSWAGAAFDLTVAFLLWNRRSRPWAYAVAFAFHAATYVLFNIGVFPFVMMVAALVFFEADQWRWLWRRVTSTVVHPRSPDAPDGVILSGIGAAEEFEELCPRGGGGSQGQHPSRTQSAEMRTRSFDSPGLAQDDTKMAALPLSRWPFALAAVLLAIQLAVPLRHWLYPGDRFWTEEGYRFAWHVMVAAKTGHATFLVRDPATDRRWTILPSDDLTAFQEKEMVAQPDFIWQYAQHVERRFQAAGYDDVEVRAEVYVNLNGQDSRLLIDPDVDLTAVGRHVFSPKPWIYR
ncbi:MAG: HTTM domain-containing protein [Bacteroidota bacterium]